MEAKEKARELVDKYSFVEIQHYTSMFEVKECALIAVDEILKRNEPIQGHFWDYWEQVKQEIIKLKI